MGGRGRGGWGRGRGAVAPPMGLTHADMQNLSREATAMYPPMIPPILTEPTDDEKQIARFQHGFAERLRRSKYYVVETVKTNDLPRYSDKYRPSVTSQPKMKKEDLHAPYFPPEIFEDYFNPKRKRKVKTKGDPTKKRMNIDDIDEDEDEKGDGSDQSNAGSQVPSDYDGDEDYGDNDYAQNYFDNGEADDFDNLDGGGGDDGGAGDYE